VIVTHKTQARGALVLFTALPACCFCVLSHFCGVAFCLNFLFRLNILLSVCFLSCDITMACVPAPLPTTTLLL
jgi:hypothetical protein